MRKVSEKLRYKPGTNDDALMPRTASYWDIAIGGGLVACLLSIISCSLAGHSQQPDSIVYQYFAPTDVAVARMKHIRNFQGINGYLVEEIYKKPINTPGSSNYVRIIGGDDLTGNEVVYFSVLDRTGKTLFKNHQYERWSTRSSAVTDYYYILSEPVPHESVIAMRGDHWETVRKDTRAVDYDYPYEIVEISSSSVNQFACVFDKAALTSIGQRKVLAAVVGNNRPEDSLDVIAKWLSENGAHSQADHCRRGGDIRSQAAGTPPA